MKSIKMRLICSFGVMLILICAVLGFFANREATEAVKEEGEHSLEVASMEASMLIRSFMDQKIVFMEAIAAQKIVTDDTPWEEKVAVLQAEAERNGYETFAIIDMNGNARRLVGESVNITDRAYYKLAMSGKSNVSDVLISKVTGKPSIIVCVPVIRNGAIVGGIYGVTDGTLITDITNQIKVGKAGYAFIVNKSGTLMAHPKAEHVLNQYNPVEDAKDKPEMKELADIISNRMTKGETGIGSYFFEGSQRIMAYTPIQDSEWSVAVAMQESEMLEHIKDLNIWMLITSAVAILLGMVATYIISIFISKPVALASLHAEKIAQLDITQDVPPVFLKRKDEVGALAKSFQLVTDNLRSFIKGISAASEQVASSSEELTATSQQAATSAEEVARTIEEMARGAGDQARDTEIGSVKINEIGSLIAE